MKKITLTESDLTKLIKNIVTQKLSQINEESADINGDGIISPEELYQHFDLDGDGIVTMVDYAAHVDFHAENPELLSAYRDSEEYTDKMSQDREPFIQFFPMADSSPMMEQYDDDDDDDDFEDDDPNTVATFPVDDVNFDLDDAEMYDINTYNGPMRRARGSIYIDLMVPDSDDIEYDRKLGVKMLEYYSKKLKVENYVGGLGFKRGIEYDSDF